MPRSISGRTSTGARARPRIHLTAPYFTGAEGRVSIAVVNSPERRGVSSRTGPRRAPPGSRPTPIPARRAGRDDQGSARARGEGHGRPALSELSRGGLAGGRQPRARHVHRVRLRPRETARGLSLEQLAELGRADPSGPTAEDVIQTLVKHKVPVTSALAVYEPFVANRPTKDARTLEAMTPRCATHLQIRHEIDSSGSGPVAEEASITRWPSSVHSWRRGVLGRASTRPAWAAPAGYGDQRTTSCSSKRVHPVAGGPDHDRQRCEDPRLRSSRHGGAGQARDLVVLKAISPRTHRHRNATMVFKDGIGYDPAKLIASVQGRVGID